MINITSRCIWKSLNTNKKFKEKEEAHESDKSNESYDESTEQILLIPIKLLLEYFYTKRYKKIGITITLKILVCLFFY